MRHSLAPDSTRSSAVCDYAQQIMHAKDKVGATLRGEAVAFTEASLRQKERERLKAVGDEALIDLDDHTMMLAAKRG